jgi:hypothetical protein
MCCLLEEAVCRRMDHRIVCDHQVFVQQHHQHVTTHQGCSPCACPKRLHGTLDGHCNPSTLANAVPISKKQAVAYRHVLCVGVADCEGVGTLLSSIIPECKEVTKEDGIERKEDAETISRMS